jgi:hypothetical protein
LHNECIGICGRPPKKRRLISELFKVSFRILEILRDLFHDLLCKFDIAGEREGRNLKSMFVQLAIDWPR